MKLDGISSAATVMGTTMNLDLLREQGFETADAAPDDLVVAIEAEGQDALDAALVELQTLLSPPATTESALEAAPASIEAALRTHPGSNVVVIAVPGECAAIEAWSAIRAGRHAFIFSDNVDIEDERLLKEAAANVGLLCMGPDCGTAILGGVGLGFANRVRRGSIGLVGASGTGIQQVSSLIHMAGGGIAEAIGTGSHDLSSTVGGTMTMMGIDRLAANPAVEKIGLISKPADPSVAENVLKHLAQTRKPAVACLLGGRIEAPSGVDLASTLTEMAERLLGSKLDLGTDNSLPATSSPSEPRKLVGLFGGGTLREEARQIAIQSGYTAGRFVDLGDDEFTRGRAHPMIDPRLRASMIESAGDEADVVLLDVLLGDMAHEDPAGAIFPAILKAQARAERAGRTLSVFAALIGTDLDLQGLADQRAKLEVAQVSVTSSNALAARWAARAATGQ